MIAVDQVLDARAQRIEVHPRASRSPRRTVPCGPARTASPPPTAAGPRGPRPCRSSPCTACPAGRGRRRRATRRCRRTRSRSSRSTRRRRAPARRPCGCLTPPSAQTCLPSLRASAAHSSTALNWGRPTPVRILVVHIAPGPTPTLTMSAPASIRSAVPAAVTTLPATTGTDGDTERTACRAQIIFSWCPCAVSTTSRSGPGVEQLLGPPGDVAVDAERGADPQPALGVGGRLVDRRAERAGAGQDADAAAVLVDHRRELVPPGLQQPERPLRIDAGGQGEQLRSTSPGAAG